MRRPSFDRAFHLVAALDVKLINATSSTSYLIYETTASD